jgi:hypothetical protein
MEQNKSQLDEIVRHTRELIIQAGSPQSENEVISRVLSIIQNERRKKAIELQAELEVQLKAQEELLNITSKLIADGQQ